MQRLIGNAILCINISHGDQQQFRNVLVAKLRSQKQWCIKMIIPAVNQIRIGFDQRLDLAHIASFCRVMNLAAEGEAAQSQHDQPNSAKAEN